MIKMGLLWLLGAPLLVPTVQVLAEPHGNNAVPNHYDNERRLRKSTNPSIGSFKALILLVKFPDHNDRELVDKSIIEEMWRDTIAPYYFDNSQGRYQVEPVVTDWIKTDNTEEYYSFGNQGYDYDIQKAMYPVLDALDSDPNWDWSQFDVNQDGELDAVVFMHSGYSAIAGETDCTGRADTFRIWDHAYEGSIPTNTWISSDESIRLNGYAISSVYKGSCDDEGPLTPGLLTHEYMHTMGLIDLYDTGEPLGEAEGIGIWCLMASPYGLNGRGYPLMMSAWSRWDANWLEPILIVKDDTYQIQAAALSDDAYRINLNDPSTGQPAEYLLIENRQQVGFDENLPGAGLIIYHIDDAADDMKNRGYPGQEGEVPWPQNGNHYRVAVLPFDGNYDLEQDVNKGDAGDMWMAGSELGPGMGNTIFPNTDSYQNGTIRETGITIKVVEQVGTDILFEVIGVGNANTPGIATDSPSNQPSATTPTTDSPSNQPSATTPTTVSPTVSPGTPTAVPTQAPSQGPTRPGFNEDWWVLTREPSPSRSPVNLPEFPVGESVNDLAEIGNARSSGIASLKGGGWVCSPFLLLLVGSSLYLMSL